MKTVFSLIFSCLIILTVIAAYIQPDLSKDGRTPIVWVSDDNPARRDQIDLFNKLNPNYNLMLDPAVGYDSSKIIVQSVAGVGPDVFDCFGNQLPTYVKADIPMDITDEMKKIGFDANEEIWEGIHNAMIYKGRVYGIATNVGTFNIMFHKDIFDKAGMPYLNCPWKW
ncbi:MAG: extracellular solute-binding protein, partial [Armatimonadota bacterium]